MHEQDWLQLAPTSHLNRLGWGLMFSRTTTLLSYTWIRSHNYARRNHSISLICMETWLTKERKQSLNVLEIKRVQYCKIKLKIVNFLIIIKKIDQGRALNNLLGAFTNSEYTSQNSQTSNILPKIKDNSAKHLQCHINVSSQNTKYIPRVQIKQLILFWIKLGQGYIRQFLCIQALVSSLQGHLNCIQGRRIPWDECEHYIKSLTQNNNLNQVDILTLSYNRQQLQVHYTQVDPRHKLT